MTARWSTTPENIPDAYDRPGPAPQVVRRHALTNGAWQRVRSLFDRPAGRGRPPRPARTMLEAVLWILATGAPWRDLPEWYGPWQTVYGRFRAWVAAGVLDRALRRLVGAVRRGPGLDDPWCVDTTVIRASRAAAGASTRPAGEPADHALGRSRGGFGTKVSLVCDGRGAPLSAHVAPGQQHDLLGFEPVLRDALAVGRPRRVAADKAYSVAWTRRWLDRRRIRPVIPTRSDQRRDPSFSPVTYRRRNVVERLVGWLKESRRLATRHEKLAVTFLAVVKLAMIRRLLRVLEFPDTT